jgi:starvation-inducible outer membrane lipoprotein
MNRKMLFLVILSIFILSGCVTSTRRLNSISLGMSKQEIIKELGQPAAFRGAFKDESGKNLEAYEYVLCKPSADKIICWDTSYLLWFSDGKLTRWGEVNDWVTTADREGERKLKITTEENIKIKKE